MSDEEYYMRIEDPPELRKALLESSKDIILGLKDYHKLKSMKKNKLELIEVLKDQMKEITFLMEKLNDKIPDKELEYEADLVEKAEHPPVVEEAKVETVDVPEEQPESKPVEIAPKPEPKPVSEMDKLQNALSSIENKLSKL